MASRASERIWLRQPKETAKAFEAFAIYKELGASRSIEAAGKRLGKSNALLENWSSQHLWVSRARAWDEHLGELEARARIEAEQRRATRRAEAQIRREDREEALADALTERAEMMLKFPLSSAKTSSEQVVDPVTGQVVENKTTVINPAKWQFRDAALIADTASKLGRRALGMDEERTAHTLSGPGGGPVQVETQPAAFDLERLTTEQLVALSSLVQAAARPDPAPEDED